MQNRTLNTASISLYTLILYCASTWKTEEQQPLYLQVHVSMGEVVVPKQCHFLFEGNVSVRSLFQVCYELKIIPTINSSLNSFLVGLSGEIFMSLSSGL